MSALPTADQVRDALRAAGISDHALDSQFDGLEVYAISGQTLVLSLPSWLAKSAWRSHKSRLQAAAQRLLGDPAADVVLRDENGTLTPADAAAATTSAVATAALTAPRGLLAREGLEAGGWTRQLPFRRSGHRKGAIDRLDELDTIGVWTPAAGHLPLVRNPHATFSPARPLSYTGVEGTGHATFTPTLMHLRVATVGVGSLARICSLADGLVLCSISLLGRSVLGRKPYYHEASRLRNVLYDLCYGDVHYRSRFGARHELPGSPITEVYLLAADGQVVTLRDIWQPDPEHRDRGTWLMPAADSGVDETMAIRVRPEVLAAAHATDDELGELATLISRPAALAAGRALPLMLRLAARAPRTGTTSKEIYLAAPMLHELGYFTAEETTRLVRDVAEDLRELAAIATARLAITGPSYNDNGLATFQAHPQPAPAATSEPQRQRVPTRARRRSGQPPASQAAQRRRHRVPITPLGRPPRRSAHVPPQSASRLRARISALTRGGDDPAAQQPLLAA